MADNKATDKDEAEMLTWLKGQPELYERFVNTVKKTDLLLPFRGDRSQ